MKAVVIADDEPALRLLVTTTIASDGYTIYEAADGEQAWQLIRQHRPAVALLDVQMPGRTGLELTRSVRESPELAGTQVVLLSSKAQQADIQAGLQAGADLYLTKPFSPLELLTVLERALRDQTGPSMQRSVRVGPADLTGC